ncbi:MAG: Mini-ribonuclease 3 [Clostridia bacterium]|nr:Mini-ribonuclease 3 [Clostridia bacterium]
MEFNFITEKFDENDIFNMPSTTLAFVGDAFFSLYVKTKVLNKNAKSGKFHLLSTNFVKASAQRGFLNKVLNNLTEREKDVVRRAKNTHTSSKSKNAGLSDYKNATAYEALIGYLFLNKNEQRLKEILDISFEEEL